MQIILLEKVAKLGNLGDVVRVKDGYARNYLIPQGKAKRATQAAMQEFEVKRAELEKMSAEKLVAAQDFAQRLEAVVVAFSRKAGVDGRLFGSVTQYDVATALRELGFDVDRSSIRMPDGHLKAVGEFDLEVAIHADVLGSIKVRISAE